MANRNRIPAGDSDFNDYINQTAAYLLVTPSSPGTMPHWERLGLLAAENTQWQDYMTDWNSKYGTVVSNNAANIQDRNAIERKNKVRENFTAFVVDKNANKLNRIGASPNVTANDRSVFNIKLRDDKPTARAKITTAPYVDFKPLEGGIVQVTCQVDKVSDRPSMHPEADFIEMKYIVIEEGALPPSIAGDCPNTFMPNKAISLFEGAADHPGKRLHAFLRWRNNVEPTKSGPWSQKMTIIIGD